MAQVEIYSKSDCPYCEQAKLLFKDKGVHFKEYDITGNGKLQKEMMKRSEGKLMTVPQIYINRVLIGGYSDLQALDDSGELEKLLRKPAKK